MRALSYAMLVIFSLLLVALIPSGIMVFSAESTFLKAYNSETYLADSGLYGNFKQAIRKKVVGESGKENQSVVDKLRMKLVGQAFDKIVTDDFISLKMSHLQTSMWDYLTDKTDKLLTVPIPEISDALMKLPGQKLTEHGDLISLLGLKANQMETFKTYYKLYEKGLWVLYILLVIVVVLYSLLTYVLNISGKWLGITLIIGGGLALVSSIPIKLWAGSNINLSNHMEDFGDGIRGLIIAVRHDFSQRMSTVAIIVIVVGILVMFIKPRRASYIKMD